MEATLKKNFSLIEWIVYGAAAVLAIRRYKRSRERTETLGELNSAPLSQRTVTILGTPEQILSHLELAQKLHTFAFHLKPAPQGRGTEVTIFTESDAIRKLLRSIKMIVETGEVATTVGQTHGRKVCKRFAGMALTY